MRLFFNLYKEKLKIQIINFEQIYNIFMNYAYDFKKSNFVVCDAREKANNLVNIDR